jgi:HEAT repeat protein
MPQAAEKALDWQGQEVCCDGCVHRELIHEQRCQQKHICVQDRSPSRIEQFFKTNPGLANEFLTHPYFEVRAAAAKFVDIFYLTSLLNDVDETVRWHAALRLPRRFLLRLREDPHREVRVRVASHIEGEDLVPMMSDPDYYVRQVVAQRIGTPLLKHMMDDPDPEVRRVVAQRIAVEWLPELIDDPDAAVALAVAERLTPTQLLPLRFHSDFRVRYEAAGRVPISAVAGMQNDEDSMVRERVLERLAENHADKAGEHLVIEMSLAGREVRRS